MSKRFTCTDKWKKRFIKNLPIEYKLLWFYILDDCDHAGIWHTDFEVASIRIGNQIDEKIAIDYFEEKICIIDNGEKWFIPSFINFQYGELKEDCKPHKSVITILKKYSLYKQFTEGMYTLKDKDKDKDKDKEGKGLKEINIKCLEIYNYWNSFKTVVHEKMTTDMKKAIEDRLKTYGEKKLKEAIENYAEMINEPKFFYEYEWTIEEFLKRKKGMVEFFNDGIKWRNYTKWYNKTQEPEVVENEIK